MYPGGAESTGESLGALRGIVTLARLGKFPRAAKRRGQSENCFDDLSYDRFDRKEISSNGRAPTTMTAQVYTCYTRVASFINQPFKRLFLEP